MSAKAQNYHEALEKLAENFAAKEALYGPSWRVMRLPSLIDLLFVKAYRARNLLTEAKEQKVNEPLSETFLDIASYAAITHIQASLSPWRFEELLDPPISYIPDFLSVLDAAKSLYEAKNADYGAVWRTLPLSTFSDFILARIMRLKSCYSRDQAIDLLNLSIFAYLFSPPYSEVVLRTGNPLRAT
jgi:hypothetical protein